MAGIAALLICGAVAVAAGTGGGSVIHACYAKQGGALRYVGSGTHHGTCKHSEAGLSWNSAGLPGRSAPTADLAVKIGVPTQVNLGDYFDTTVVVTNLGPSATWAGLDFGQQPFFLGTGNLPSTNRGSCPTGNGPSGEFTCALGILDHGQKATVTFRTQACDTPGKSIVTAARVVGSSIDQHAANNTALAKTLINQSNVGCG